MLMIRHSIGSRLFFQTEVYDIEQKEKRWHISFVAEEKPAAQILAFQKELNIFEVIENEKAWYYSSDAEIHFQPLEKRFVILAD